MLKRLDSLEMEGYFEDSSNKWDESDGEPSAKRQRSSDQFLLFCKYILEYERYEPQKEKEMHDNVYSSKGSTKTEDSFSSESNSSFGSSSNDETRSSDDEKISDKDSDLITCHCMKPFAGRPMIECTECQTWIHMSCANVRRKNIPEVFICQMCREASGSTRRSQRLRGDYRRLLSP